MPNKLPKYFETSSDGKNYTSFVSQAQSEDIIYKLPSSDGTNGQFLSTNGNCVLSWRSQSIISPGGSDSYIQYNNNGSFSGDVDLVWDVANKRLKVSSLDVNNISSRFNVWDTGTKTFTIPMYSSTGEMISYITNPDWSKFGLTSSFNGTTGEFRIGYSIIFGDSLPTYNTTVNIVAGTGGGNYNLNMYSGHSDGSFRITSGNGSGVAFYVGNSSTFTTKYMSFWNFCTGIGNIVPLAHLHQLVPSSSTVGHRIDLAASQSANAFEINSSGGSGGDLLKVTSSGVLNSSVGISTPGITLNGSNYTMSIVGQYIMASLKMGYSESNVDRRIVLDPYVSFLWGSGGVSNPSIGINQSSDNSGVLEINNGTRLANGGVYRDLKLRSLYANAVTATDIPLTLKLAASQSANVFEINSSGGSGGDLLKVTSSGVLNANITVPFGGFLSIPYGDLSTSGNSFVWDASTYHQRMGGSSLLQWCPGGNWAGHQDVGIGRNSVGAIEINNGTSGIYRDLKRFKIT